MASSALTPLDRLRLLQAHDAEIEKQRRMEAENLLEKVLQAKVGECHMRSEYCLNAACAVCKGRCSAAMRRRRRSGGNVRRRTRSSACKKRYSAITVHGRCSRPSGSITCHASKQMYNQTWISGPHRPPLRSFFGCSCLLVYSAGRCRQVVAHRPTHFTGAVGVVSTLIRALLHAHAHGRDAPQSDRQHTGHMRLGACRHAARLHPSGFLRFPCSSGGGDKASKEPSQAERGGGCAQGGGGCAFLSSLILLISLLMDLL